MFCRACLFTFSPFFQRLKVGDEKSNLDSKNLSLVGGEEAKKVAYINWYTICLPKNMGGLGIKNMEIFNLYF